MNNPPVSDPRELAGLAALVRQRDLEMVSAAGLGHLGGEFSATDILVTLYFGILRIDPANPNAPERDRFVLSKGHAAAALYSTLAERGFLPVEELATFMQPLSRLNGHPDRNKVPGVETNTGPLGHGLPVAVGMALAARMDRSPRRVYAITGDGELQEGSMWEAAMAAAHFGLDNLVAIVDRNGLQQGDATERTIRLEPLADKWTSFGWTVREVDGHDHAALLDLLRSVPFTRGRPSLVIAHTQKGHGVSFMTDRAEWHHKVPNASQLAAAREELRRPA
jgi:transketolase